MYLIGYHAQMVRANTIRKTEEFDEWMNQLKDRKGRSIIAARAAAAETGKKMAIKTLPFDAAEYLTDEQAVADFLNASAQMGDSAVLLNALNTVARGLSGGLG